MKEVLQLVNAIQHKSLHVNSAHYRTFLKQQLSQVNSIAHQYPVIDRKLQIDKLQLKIGLPEQQLK